MYYNEYYQSAPKAGEPGPKQLYSNSVAYEQQQSSQGKEYEQPRFYGSPVIVQQPYVQMPPNAQYTINQSVIYPSQQQYYESIPVNNYLLIPNAPTNNMAANGTYYNSSYYQAPRQPIQPQVAIHHQPVAPQQSAVPVTQQQAAFYANFNERLRGLLPVPPLSKAEIRPEINLNLNQKRAKRKSKFTQRQDDLIVSLKKEGKSWVEIAEYSGVGSYLAARNRYQVIVGQQGNNNSSSWTSEDKNELRELLDDGEIAKWKYISAKLNRATNKNFTPKECRDLLRSLFWANPASFGVQEDTINECVKEKIITKKSIEQELKNSNERQYAHGLLANNSVSSVSTSSVNSNSSTFYNSNTESDNRSASDSNDVPIYKGYYY